MLYSQVTLDRWGTQFPCRVAPYGSINDAAGLVFV
jgi:hypothetical protein